MQEVVIVKKIVLLFLCLALLSAAGCKTENKQLMSVPKIEINKLMVVSNQSIEQANEQTSLDEIISSYLAQEVSFKVFGDKGIVSEAHEVYGTEEKDSKTYVYIWSVQQEYAYIDNDIVRGAGTSMPLVIILERDGENGYDTITHMAPLDGERYISSVKNLFPEKYHDKIFERVHAKELEEIVKQKAINYFTSSVDENMASEIIQDINEDDPSLAIDGKDGVKLKGTGTYIGQIDGNSIEVELNMDSGEKVIQAFRFSDAVKSEFDNLALETGDVIELTYIKNGYDQLVIMSIEKSS